MILRVFHMYQTLPNNTKHAKHVVGIRLKTSRLGFVVRTWFRSDVPCAVISMAFPTFPSKTWSCGSLAAGNNELLGIKSEAARSKQADLEAQKKAGSLFQYSCLICPTWFGNR